LYYGDGSGVTVFQTVPPGRPSGRFYAEASRGLDKEVVIALPRRASGGEIERFHTKHHRTTSSKPARGEALLDWRYAGLSRCL
jgi:hypothetical protein